MSDLDLIRLLRLQNLPQWRTRLARWVESSQIQGLIIAVILINAVVLGLETFPTINAQYGELLHWVDQLCLAVFVCELTIKLCVYRGIFWRNSWNWFDFIIVAVSLVPGSGPLSVLRTSRNLRVLRLLTAIPSLRKVVAAFLHSIPGLTGVIAIMCIFFFTAGVLATHLFGHDFPQWFGSLALSLYTLFQIMTLESWSMGIVRPIMEVHPLAWMFFVPFIIIATFTILNLFIGIIVSTMQELSNLPDPNVPDSDLKHLLARMENDIRALRTIVEHNADNTNDSKSS